MKTDYKSQEKKKTIYNVLAIDRCSTCVTVLIYETKMVTVNYVFLCAFFKVGGRRKKGIAVPCFVFVEYNGNNQVKKKKENI